MVKNTLKVVGILLLAYTILPTADPSDIFITLPLIAYIGLTNYIILCIVIIFLLYQWIEGRTIKAKITKP